MVSEPPISPARISSSSSLSLPVPSTARVSVSSTSSLPPPAPSRVSTARRKLYLHHEAVADSLRGKDDQFRQAAARALHSSHAVARAQKQLHAIRQTESHLDAQLRREHARKLRNKLFKNRAAALTSSLESKLTAVSGDAAVAAKAVKQAKHVAATDTNRCDALRGDAETLVAAERERRHILEDAFGGMGAGSPVENSIETERDRLAVVTHREKDKLSSQKHAYHLLKQAGVELSAAKKSLYDAQLTNTVDIFAGGGVGFVAGLGSQYNINEAAKQAQSAGRKIQLAVQMNPRLPINKLAKVQNGAVLGFADIFLDGFVTDLIIRYTIEKAAKSVDAVLEALKESLAVQKSIVRKLDGRVRSYSDDLKRTSEDLVRVRAELLHGLEKVGEVEQ